MRDAPATAARFTGLAQVYDRYRPHYPAAALDAVLAGLPPQPEIVDVGAGTGISTRAMAALGARVIAIEPNAEMRGFARAAGLDARDGRADATGLPAACADAVTAFQAFHWFASVATLAEFARLLRPAGRIALVWNERDVRGDALTAAAREIERRFADASQLAGSDFVDETLEPLLRGAGFPRVRTLQFDNAQRLDREGLIGRVRSTSYAPRSGPRLGEMIAALETLHERYADRSGHVTLMYRTDVILGER